MRRSTSCPLQHVDPDKVQVDVTTWSEMQKATTNALTAQQSIADKIAAAVAAERESAQAMRSDDITGIQAGNRLLREQLAQANADAKDRDQRILELLARVDTLQKEVAQLQGQRAEVTLAENREQRTLDLTRAQIQSSDDRFKAVMGHLAPLVPLLTQVGASVVANKMGGAMPAPPFAGGPAPGPAAAPAPFTPSPSPAPANDAAASEPEVIETAVWTHNRIGEWKTALIEVLQASTPQTASLMRFSVMNLLAYLHAPPGEMPELLRGLIEDAGAERFQRLVTLTIAGRPN